MERRELSPDDETAPPSSSDEPARPVKLAIRVSPFSELFAVVDPNGQLVAINAELERFLGVTTNQLSLGHIDGQSLIHELDQPLILSVRAMLSAGGSCRFEYRLLDRHRRYRWVEASATFYEGLIYIASRDVTDRKIQEAIADYESRVYKSIARGDPLSATMELVCRSIDTVLERPCCTLQLLSTDGLRFIASYGDPLLSPLQNLALGRVIGPAAATFGTAAFRRAGVVSHEIETDPLWSGMKDVALDIGIRACWSLPIFSRDKTVLAVFALYSDRSGSPTQHEQHVVARFADATGMAIERSRLDSEIAEARNLAEAANRTKSAFVANMTHELRTPLNAIIGFSELVQMEALGPLGNPRYREYAGDIHDAGRHLLSLINDLLDVARIEAGNVIIEPETIEIRGFVREKLRQIDRAFPDHCPISVSSLSEQNRLEGSESGVSLTADLRALTQILLNVVGNAVKFTPKAKSVEITFDESAPGLRIIVEDGGIGIPADKLERIGQPFFQAGNAFSREFGGTGLGVFISRSLMVAHGGSLFLTSEYGRGTTVTLAFPEELVTRTVHAIESDTAFHLAP